jgi:hypothetical protein
MPDTRATRVMVEAAWKAVVTQRQRKADKDPDFSQEKLDRASYNLRQAIIAWEAPGKSDTFDRWTQPTKEKFLKRLKKKFGKAQ